MAHRPLCGAGTWVQAQQSFLFFGMASAVPASCQHPSHSLCNAESRDRDLFIGQFIMLNLDSMPCNGSQTFPLFTGYELACLAYLALIHTQQVQNLQISITPTWNRSLCQCHDRLVNLQTPFNKECSEQIHKHIQSVIASPLFCLYKELNHQQMYFR